LCVRAMCVEEKIYKYVMFYNNIFIKANHTPTMTQPNYTDTRTGIVYAHVGVGAAVKDETPDLKMQPHLDAFISPAFLKTYFADGKGKSKS